VLTSELYTSVRESGKRLLHGLPRTRELVRKTEEYAKGMITPTASTFFEELGFNYIGPVNGHDLPSLVQTLEAIKDFEGPWFLHVLTQKGKGFTPAEEDPIGYHAIGKHSSVKSPANSPAAPAKKPTYSNVFGQWLCDMAKVDARLNGITPAMREGSDLVRFSEEFPDRYHDVAIAEQHAITLAAGMACEGYKPVVAIYSTFLQRGYDQLIHDVALQDLDVLFAIDRAGLVGEDGPTHAGVYDLSFLRCVPNMVVMAPSDEAETRLLLNTGYHHHGPAAVRYPRGTGSGVPAGDSLDTIPLGKARVLREGKGLAILAFGSLTTPARKVADALDATLVDMRFVKPLDEALVLDMATRHLQLVTLEENTLAGGAGAAVLELLARARIQTPVHCLGLPDRVIEHGKPDELLSACGLDATGIEKSIRTHCDLDEVINMGQVSLQAP
jgi:1-deoxy-D-xylulose-5-phosphate synthase